MKLSDCKLSTYVNALAKAGFVIEQLIEQSDEDIIQSYEGDVDIVKKAKMLSLTFVIKARAIIYEEGFYERKNKVHMGRRYPHIHRLS